MKHIFTISLCFLALSLSVYGQVPDYVPTEGLVAWYPLDGNALDSHINHLTIDSDGLEPGENRFGIASSALRFSGNQINSNSSELNLSTFESLTISIWISLHELQSYFTILGNTEGPGGTKKGMLMYGWGGINAFVWHVNSPSQSGYGNYSYPTSLNVDEWVHVVYVKDGNNFQFYLNGTYAGGGNYDYGQPVASAPFELGGATDGSSGEYNLANSTLDELGIWNRDLTQQEILSIYLSEQPAEGCTDSMSCNFSLEAVLDDGSCLYIDACGECGGDGEAGCTDSYACNYDSEAGCDDGTCDYTCCPGPGCCNDGTLWDEVTQTCIVTKPTDTNFDGCTDLNDLMDILAAYGSCTATLPDFVTCGDDIEHEGYDYSTVEIGDQCWFSENCRYLPSVSPSSEGNETDPYYYVHSYEGTDVEAAKATSNYETYGVLYNWPAAITEGLCPSGWHVPTDGEFTQLTDFLGGQSLAGGEMKEAGYDHWNLPNSEATNSSGFNGLPGGVRNLLGNFDDIEGYGTFWSSNYNNSQAWYRQLQYDTSDVYRASAYLANSHSARCIKD